MSKAVVIIDMPRTCGECIFSGDSQELLLGKGLYKKIARCRIAPEEIEDPWRDVYWQIYHKEKWCPLKEIKD